MKGYSRLSVALVLALWAGSAGCRKDGKAKEVASVAQDTMLLHDLAEANKNTAAAAAADNSLTTVRTTGDGTMPGAEVSPPSTTQPPLTSGPRIKAPTTANDAPGPTTVPIERSPAASRLSGDPCDSPSAVDQRSCLNRSIVANDADLNRTYQELVAQSRKSGGPDLEERIRQSQREWVNQRDAECRPDTQSGFWAKSVAKCLANHSDKRTAELRRTLAGLRGQ